MTDPDDGQLTEKQRWFITELSHDFNPVRAMRKVGMSQSEYDSFTNNPATARLLRHAQERAVARIEAEKNPTGTPIQSAEVGTRDFVSAELLSVLEDLKAERISPGQASAAKAVLETYAKVNGLIATEVNLNVKKSLDTMSTAELEALVSGRLIDVTPTRSPLAGDG